MTLQMLWQIAGLLSIASALGRWVLKFYFDKSKDLEALKAQNRAAADQQMKTNIDELRASVTRFQSEMGTIRERMAEYAGSVRESNRAMELIQKQFEKVSDRLEDRYKALEGAEIVKVGKDTYIFKTRRSGGGG